jgi:hypothetical protein
MNRLKAEKNKEEGNRLKEIWLRKESALAIQVEKADKKRIASENKARELDRKRIKKTSDMYWLQGFKDEAARRARDKLIASSTTQGRDINNDTGNQSWYWESKWIHQSVFTTVADVINQQCPACKKKMRRGAFPRGPKCEYTYFYYIFELARMCRVQKYSR